jgi:hypothetical protein
VQRIVTPKIQTALARIRLYLDRAEDSINRGDSTGALPHLAELGEIARRLWLALAAREPPHQDQTNERGVQHR